MTVHAARIRIQIEFIEMPGLKLTLAQIGRLCNLPSEICEPAVTLLVAGGFLAGTRDGAYLRRGLFSDGAAAAPPAAAICGRLA
jgi:hypothetical protein